MDRRGLRLAMIAMALGLFATVSFGSLSARAANTPAELVGNWQLVTLQGAGAAVDSTAGAGITLNFQADGRAGGNGGCNVFGATVVTDDQGRFKLDGLVSTLRACVDQKLNDREKQYFDNLREARGYTLDGNTLRLNFDQPGRQLIFAREGAGGTPGMPNTGGGGQATDKPVARLALLGGIAGVIGLGLVLRRRVAQVA